MRERIARAAEANGRTADAVRLVAVSKTFGLDAIRAAIDAGHRDFGENRVQEALPKIEALAAGHPDLRWHLIGHLQSNKARKAGRPFDAIHSVDSLDLLRRLDDAAAEGRRLPQFLVQVDLAGEATKFGAPPDEARTIVREATTLKAGRLGRADDAAAVLRRPGRGAAGIRAAAGVPRRAASPTASRRRSSPSCRWA